jgi:hypothetical protein
MTGNTQHAGKFRQADGKALRQHGGAEDFPTMACSPSAAVFLVPLRLRDLGLFPRSAAQRHRSAAPSQKI